MILGLILNLLDLHVPLPKECTDKRRFKYNGNDIEGGLAFKREGSIDMVCFSPDVFECNLADFPVGQALQSVMEAKDIEGWKYGFKEGLMPCRDGTAIYERREDGWYRHMLKRDPKTKENKVVSEKLPWRLNFEIDKIIVEYFSDKAHLLNGKYLGPDKGE